MAGRKTTIAKQLGVDETELREIQEIERPVDDKWFVECINEYGERELYLRVKVTGLYPRRIGPFQSKWDAMIVLSCFLCRIEDELPDLIKDDETPLRLIIEDHIIKRAARKGR